MVYILKRGASKKEIETLEKKIYTNKVVITGFNAKKCNGALKLKEDALSIQKKLRDEWERDFS